MAARWDITGVTTPEPYLNVEYLMNNEQHNTQNIECMVHEMKKTTTTNYEFIFNCIFLKKKFH